MASMDLPTILVPVLVVALALLSASYTLGYWHGSRVGAVQVVRTLITHQRRVAAEPINSTVVQVEKHTTLSPEQVRIIDLFLAGNNASNIVAILYGVTLEAGQIYMERMAYVQAVLRADLAYYHRNASMVED